MSRWAFSSIFCPGATNPGARDRFSHTHSIYTIKTKTSRPSYRAPTRASYHLTSRVSVYEKAAPSRTASFYSNRVDPWDAAASTRYRNWVNYGTSSCPPYHPPERIVYYPAPPSASAASKPYSTHVKDSYKNPPSHRRELSAARNSTHGSRPKKTVHWDDSTFSGTFSGHRSWQASETRYDRRSNDDYDYDRYGRIQGMRDTSPRVAASGNTYDYTAAASSKGRDYYRDEEDRRSRKARGYKATHRSHPSFSH